MAGVVGGAWGRARRVPEHLSHQESDFQDEYISHQPDIHFSLYTPQSCLSTFCLSHSSPNMHILNWLCFIVSFAVYHFTSRTAPPPPSASRTCVSVSLTAIISSYLYLLLCHSIIPSFLLTGPSLLSCFFYLPFLFFF